MKQLDHFFLFFPGSNTEDQKQQQEEQDELQSISEPLNSQYCEFELVIPADQMQPPTEQSEILCQLQPQQSIQHGSSMQQKQHEHPIQNEQPMTLAGVVHHSPQGDLNARPSCLPDKWIPIEILLPQHKNMPKRQAIVRVPLSVVETKKLQSMFTNLVRSAMTRLPAPQVTSLLQQHINQTFKVHLSSDVMNATPNERIPIQILLSRHQNMPERLLTVHVPSSVQKNYLQTILLTSLVKNAMIGLTVPEAASLLQQHIDQTFEDELLLTPGRVPNPVILVTQSTKNMVEPQMMQGQPQRDALNEDHAKL